MLSLKKTRQIDGLSLTLNNNLTVARSITAHNVTPLCMALRHTLFKKVSISARVCKLSDDKRTK